MTDGNKAMTKNRPESVLMIFLKPNCLRNVSKLSALNRKQSIKPIRIANVAKSLSFSPTENQQIKLRRSYKYCGFMHIKNRFERNYHKMWFWTQIGWDTGWITEMLCYRAWIWVRVCGAGMVGPECRDNEMKVQYRKWGIGV